MLFYTSQQIDQSHYTAQLNNQLNRLSYRRLGRASKFDAAWQNMPAKLKPTYAKQRQASFLSYETRRKGYIATLLTEQFLELVKPVTVNERFQSHWKEYWARGLPFRPQVLGIGNESGEWQVTTVKNKVAQLAYFLVNRGQRRVRVQLLIDNETPATQPDLNQLRTTGLTPWAGGEPILFERITITL